MSVRRSLIVLLIVSLLIPVVSAFSRANQTMTEQMMQQAALAEMQFHTVGRAEVQRTISALGAIEADETVDLSFEIGGQVAEVMVDTGDYVFAGQPLARLDNNDEQIAYEQARLALERATNYMADLIGPVDEDDITVAEANIRAAQGAYSETAGAVSQQDVQAAEMRYAQAQRNYEELQRARRVSGNLSQAEIDLLEAQIGEASFQMEIARLNLDTLRQSNGAELGEAAARIRQAEAELERVLAGPTQAEIDQAETDIAEAEANLRDAEIRLNRTILTATLDGVVTRVDIEVGELAERNVDVVEVTDREPLHLTAQVDEVDIDLIDDGMPAYIELDALPDAQIGAEVADIATLGRESDGVVSYDTEFTISLPDPNVRVGMTGEAFVVLESRADVIAVPNAYLRIDPETGSTVVDMLTSEGTLTPVPVTLGLRGENFTEIASGLSGGEVIAYDENIGTGGFAG